jgi:hypothetical protein
MLKLLNWLADILVRMGASLDEICEAVAQVVQEEQHRRATSPKEGKKS